MIACVYYSNSGTTALLAEAIAGGVTIAGEEIELVRVIDDDIQHGRYRNPTKLAPLTAAAAIVMGSPTYMGPGGTIQMLSRCHRFSLV